jgi:hypothetical protein
MPSNDSTIRKGNHSPLSNFVITMERKKYHVVPCESGWKVEPEHSHEALFINRIKDAAIQSARELAKSNKPSQVIVHGKDGKILEEYTYGDDPPESPG